jgi:hypothetical protein
MRQAKPLRAWTRRQRIRMAASFAAGVLEYDALSCTAPAPFPMVMLPWQQDMRDTYGMARGWRFACAASGLMVMRAHSCIAGGVLGRCRVDLLKMIHGTVEYVVLEIRL